MANIILAMYNPETDCVEVNICNKIYVSFNCQKCNVSVLPILLSLIRLAKKNQDCMQN